MVLVLVNYTIITILKKYSLNLKTFKVRGCNQFILATFK